MVAMDGSRLDSSNFGLHLNIGVTQKDSGIVFFGDVTLEHQFLVLVLTVYPYLSHTPQVGWVMVFMKGYIGAITTSPQ
ncbi:unnamed protein product [Lupinus luteus]|uniref:Uncharacterized protein n=1 Tax=Lupinus luteus TaxID=3873 RepID=A0AAV1YP34_LUPLU